MGLCSSKKIQPEETTSKSFPVIPKHEPTTTSLPIIRKGAPKNESLDKDDKEIEKGGHTQVEQSPKTPPFKSLKSETKQSLGSKDREQPVKKKASNFKPYKPSAVSSYNEDIPITQSKTIQHKSWWENDDNDNNDDNNIEEKLPPVKHRSTTLDCELRRTSNNSLRSGSARQNRNGYSGTTKISSSEAEPLMNITEGNESFVGNEDKSLDSPKKALHTNDKDHSGIGQISEKNQFNKHDNEDPSQGLEVTIEDVNIFEQFKAQRKSTINNDGFDDLSLPNSARNGFRSGQMANPFTTGVKDGLVGDVQFDEENPTSQPPKQVAVPKRPKMKRPQPLKRGARAAMVRKPIPSNIPTKEAVEKIMAKICELDESKWSELIKCYTEICNITQKHPKVLLDCDLTLNLETVRVLTSHINSGRSNVSKHALLCLGNIFKVFEHRLTPVLSNALIGSLKRAYSSSNEFITQAATFALSQICISSIEEKTITILLNYHNKQKSYQIAILNCLVLVLDKLDTKISNLKELDTIVDITIKGLIAASPPVRAASKILLGMINEKCELSTFTKSLRLTPDVRRNIDMVLNKYNDQDKNKLTSKLTAEI
ncbi:bifunctional Armadillo-like helical/Armadillo-type fold [Babesia duncani]|uniref:Bifunctional Armadillo-like helical/Armadillo-type fold n=1 Tax=Babesia duncani TaxID=323732 RepID=A0AAD9UQ83_9APIC|nr:bifunctional Armadillo-like helical/Armadillo-type fold [Babesia duncani]